MRTLRKQPRGAAMVEFALVAPVFVSLLLWSLFLTDLVRTRLKLQEASRFVAFEFTSYNLSDFAGANHAAAFEKAKTDIETRTTAAYSDLDSADDLTPGWMTGTFENFKLTSTNAQPPLLDTTIASESPAGPIADLIGGLVSSGIDALIGSHYDFNTSGQVTADVEVEFVNKLLPQRMLQREDGAFAQVDMWGGQNLARLKMRNAYTVIADGWSMPDGADATIEGNRAGRHRGGSRDHGLYTQVDRMNYLGINLPDEGSVLGPLKDLGTDVLPAIIDGVFVVSHNYGDAVGTNDSDGECKGPPGFPGHPYRSGMRYFPYDEMMDHRWGRCFDTAPFRDEHSYFEDDSAPSLYIRAFRARGAFGMGCQQAEANDPTTMDANPPANGDETTQIGCAEPTPP